MREHLGNTFLDNLFAFLDDAISSGAEVHIVDKSDPDKIVEHVFTGEPDDGPDESVPFDLDEDPADCDSADCNHCPYDCFLDNDEEEGFALDMWGIPEITRVIFNNPATIVFWEDGTKTVCKCMAGERYERYAGFMACCMKKMFGSTSRAKAVMNYFAVDNKPEEEKPEPKVHANIPMDETIKEAVHEALER